MTRPAMPNMCRATLWFRRSVLLGGITNVHVYPSPTLVGFLAVYAEAICWDQRIFHSQHSKWKSGSFWGDGKLCFQDQFGAAFWLSWQHGLAETRFVGHWATLTHFTEESRKTDLFFNLQMDIHHLKPLFGSEVLFVTTRMQQAVPSRSSTSTSTTLAFEVT